MTRGSGIYDDESGSTADKTGDIEKDPDRDTPDVDKESGEPTA
ncbi:hypothetical protein [Mycolicibacterium obuense]|uniref:Uncharacterized protein n=1 Tax=Mycolicibacterium obuense TaxID=1807 RepID=A0A0J6W8P7_9MYCO|nr:hypothetical protein [Mycolicibacterium obuense]KMO79570.1 hypothetical protein MOBUDSM44075_01372 [Mycolicibacterium obuense]